MAIQVLQWSSANAAVVVGLLAALGYVASHLALDRYASRYGVVVADLDVSVQDRLLLSVVWLLIVVGPYALGAVVGRSRPTLGAFVGFVAWAATLTLTDPLTRVDDSTLGSVQFFVLGLGAFIAGGWRLLPHLRQGPRLAAVLWIAISCGANAWGGLRYPGGGQTTVAVVPYLVEVEVRGSPWLHLVLPRPTQGLVRFEADSRPICGDRIADRVYVLFTELWEEGRYEPSELWDEGTYEPYTVHTVLGARPYSFLETSCSDDVGIGLDLPERSTEVPQD